MGKENNVIFWTGYYSEDTYYSKSYYTCLYEQQPKHPQFFKDGSVWQTDTYGHYVVFEKSTVQAEIHVLKNASDSSAFSCPGPKTWAPYCTDKWSHCKDKWYQNECKWYEKDCCQSCTSK